MSTKWSYCYIPKLLLFFVLYCILVYITVHYDDYQSHKIIHHTNIILWQPFEFELVCNKPFPLFCLETVSLSGVGTLQQVKIPIIEQNSCNSMYKVQSYYSETVDILPDMICAGFKDGGKDSCQVALFLSAYTRTHAQTHQTKGAVLHLQIKNTCSQLMHLCNIMHGYLVSKVGAHVDTLWGKVTIYLSLPHALFQGDSVGRRVCPAGNRT